MNYPNAADDINARICEVCGVPEHTAHEFAELHVDRINAHTLAQDDVYRVRDILTREPSIVPLLARLVLGPKRYPEIVNGADRIGPLMNSTAPFGERLFPCIPTDVARDLLADPHWLVEEAARVYDRFPQNQNTRWHGAIVAVSTLQFLVDCAELIEKGVTLGPHLADLHRQYAVRIAVQGQGHNCDAYVNLFGSVGPLTGTSGRAKIRSVSDREIWAQTIGVLPECTLRYVWNTAMRGFVSPESMALLMDLDMFGDELSFYDWKGWPRGRFEDA